MVTLWAFIGQALDPDYSCNRALSRIQVHRAAMGLKPSSADTGAYCKARINSGGVEMWRGGLGWHIVLADPFGCRCLTSHTMLRFHIPLFKPDVRFSRIRLSDKDSRFRPRQAAHQHRQAVAPVPTSRGGMRVRVTRRTRTVYLVLTTQPPARPPTHMRISGNSPVRPAFA